MKLLKNKFIYLYKVIKSIINKLNNLLDDPNSEFNNIEVYHQ